MLDWTRQLISTPSPQRLPLRAGLSVLVALPPDEVVTLLRHRLGLLDAALAGKRHALAQYGREVPRLFLVESEYDLAVTVAEADWTRSLLEELVTGTHPDLPAWRAWHEGGAGFAHPTPQS